MRGGGGGGGGGGWRIQGFSRGKFRHSVDDEQDLGGFFLLAS